RIERAHRRNQVLGAAAPVGRALRLHLLHLRTFVSTSCARKRLQWGAVRRPTWSRAPAPPRDRGGAHGPFPGVNSAPPTRCPPRTPRRAAASASVRFRSW